MALQFGFSWPCGMLLWGLICFPAQKGFSSVDSYHLNNVAMPAQDTRYYSGSSNSDHDSDDTSDGAEANSLKNVVSPRRMPVPHGHVKEPGIHRTISSQPKKTAHGQQPHGVLMKRHTQNEVTFPTIRHFRQFVESMKNSFLIPGSDMNTFFQTARETMKKELSKSLNINKEAQTHLQLHSAADGPSQNIVVANEVSKQKEWDTNSILKESISVHNYSQSIKIPDDIQDSGLRTVLYESLDSGTLRNDGSENGNGLIIHTNRADEPIMFSEPTVSSLSFGQGSSNDTSELNPPTSGFEISPTYTDDRIHSKTISQNSSAIASKPKVNQQNGFALKPSGYMLANNAFVSDGHPFSNVDLENEEPQIQPQGPDMRITLSLKLNDHKLQSEHIGYLNYLKVNPSNWQQLDITKQNKVPAAQEKIQISNKLKSKTQLPVPGNFNSFQTVMTSHRSPMSFNSPMRRTSEQQGIDVGFTGKTNAFKSSKTDTDSENLTAINGRTLKNIDKENRVSMLPVSPQVSKIDVERAPNYFSSQNRYSSQSKGVNASPNIAPLQVINSQGLGKTKGGESRFRKPQANTRGYSIAKYIPISKHLDTGSFLSGDSKIDGDYAIKKITPLPDPSIFLPPLSRYVMFRSNYVRGKVFYSQTRFNPIQLSVKSANGLWKPIEKILMQGRLFP